jgi:hypothetical protein
MQLAAEHGDSVRVDSQIIISSPCLLAFGEKSLEWEGQEGFGCGRCHPVVTFTSRKRLSETEGYILHTQRKNVSRRAVQSITRCGFNPLTASHGFIKS